MADKPEIAADMDKYIQEQVDNGNCMKIDLHEARKSNQQLHFVRYNLLVCALNPASASTRSLNLLQEMFPVSAEYWCTPDVYPPKPPLTSKSSSDPWVYP